jgi:hypothetical protein
MYNVKRVHHAQAETKSEAVSLTKAAHHGS